MSSPCSTEKVREGVVGERGGGEGGGREGEREGERERYPVSPHTRGWNLKYALSL